MNPSLKQQVHLKCQQLLSLKMEDLRVQMLDLVQSSENDSKSSAGDKHETGRAMMQLEQARLGKMLHQMEQQKLMLDRLHSSSAVSHVIEGSLVTTSEKLFFLSIPLGKIEVNDVEVHIISGDSPLGLKMKGKSTGDVVDLNGIHYEIKSID